jgi:hypothetical protein
VELRSSALQHEETSDSAADINASAFPDNSFDVAGLGAIPVEGVRMWLAIDGHPGPTVSYDLDMGGMNMRVSFDEVGAKYACKKLRRGDWVLFGFNVHGVLHRIRGDYNAVIGFGVSGEIVRFID